jgi:hypothetical protein
MSKTISIYANLAFLAYLPQVQAAAQYEAVGYQCVSIHASEYERDEGYVLTRGNRLIIILRGSDDIGDWVNSNLRVWREWRRGHAGFSAAAAAVWSRIRPLVELYAKLKPGHPPITVLGHSRGGAIGLHLTHLINQHGHRAELCSFGSPRAASIDWVKQAHFPHCRVVHRDDLIPHLPPTALGYGHHGKAYVIGGDQPPVFGEAAWDGLCEAIADHCQVKRLLNLPKWLNAHQSYPAVLGGLAKLAA